MIYLILVQRRADMTQVAGWQDACASKHPQVFSTREGPTYYQASSLTCAIRHAADATNAVPPQDWS